MTEIRQTVSPHPTDDPIRDELIRVLAARVNELAAQTARVRALVTPWLAESGSVQALGELVLEALDGP